MIQTTEDTKKSLWFSVQDKRSYTEFHRENTENCFESLNY
jgi:hypothetical protein